MRETLGEEGNSRPSQKNGIDACIRISGSEYRRVKGKREREEEVCTDLGISLIKGDRVNSDKYETATSKKNGPRDTLDLEFNDCQIQRQSVN